MKKTIWIAVLMLMAALFAGCGIQREKEENKTITITLWHYYNDEIKVQFDELVNQFNETVGAEKGILVDAYSQGGVNELADTLYASANKDIGSSPMPDMFSAYSDSAYRLDQLGVVASLDNYFTEEELTQYRQEFIEDGRFSDDNSLKIFPIAKSTELLYINMTAFEKFSAETGVTLDSLQTWEGIASTAEKYYEWCGKSFFGIDSMANFMIIAAKQLGMDIVSVDDGKSSFDLSKEAARKIWDVYYVPYIKGYYTNSGRFRSDDVKSDLIIAFVGSNSSASYFPKMIETGKDSGYDISSGVLPYPYFENGEKYCVQQGAGMVVTKSDARKEEACVEFLKWITAPEQNLEFAISTSYMPVENVALNYEVTIKGLGTQEQSDIRVQTASALYHMMDEYSIYACKPFAQSKDIRTILDKSLMTFINTDLEELNIRMNGGEPQDALFEEYTGEKNFEKWYFSLVNEINSLL